MFRHALNKLNEQTLCFHDWINRPTLKDNTASCCCTLLICGGPCHLSSFQQCFGHLIFVWEQLVYSVMENIFDFALSPHSYCVFCISSPKLRSAPLKHLIKGEVCTFWEEILNRRGKLFID